MAELLRLGAMDLALCGAYIALNAALNFANRWALGISDFGFPLVLTAAHMLLNPLLLAPVLLRGAYSATSHKEVLRDNWRGLLTIATLNGAQIAMNNSSLALVELSTNQVVRANMPVVVALFELCRGRAPPLAQMPVLAAIAVGVMMVVYQADASRAELFGVLLVVLSVSLQAGQMSFAGSLLSVKLDSLQMTFYVSPMSFLVLAGPVAYIEGSGFGGYAATRPGMVAMVLVGTCSLAVVYNVVLFQTIHRLDPIGSSVLGNVKVVVLLVMSSVLMGEMTHWTARHYVGCVLTFGGAAVYSLQKVRASRPAAAGDRKAKKGD